MLRLDSAVIRFCLGSAIVVALVAIGVVLASSLPEVGQTESCELKSPYLIADGGKSLDQRFAVVVDPAGRELGMPEGQTIQLSLAVIHGSVL